LRSYLRICVCRCRLPFCTCVVPVAGLFWFTHRFTRLPCVCCVHGLLDYTTARLVRHVLVGLRLPLPPLLTFTFTVLPTVYGSLLLPFTLVRVACLRCSICRGCRFLPVYCSLRLVYVCVLRLRFWFAAYGYRLRFGPHRLPPFSSRHVYATHTRLHRCGLRYARGLRVRVVTGWFAFARTRLRGARLVHRFAFAFTLLARLVPARFYVGYRATPARFPVYPWFAFTVAGSHGRFTHFAVWFYWLHVCAHVCTTAFTRILYRTRTFATACHTRTRFAVGWFSRSVHLPTGYLPLRYGSVVRTPVVGLPVIATRPFTVLRLVYLFAVPYDLFYVLIFALRLRLFTHTLLRFGCGWFTVYACTVGRLRLHTFTVWFYAFTARVYRYAFTCPVWFCPFPHVHSRLPRTLPRYPSLPRAHDTLYSSVTTYPLRVYTLRSRLVSRCGYVPVLVHCVLPGYTPFGLITPLRHFVVATFTVYVWLPFAVARCRSFTGYVCAVRFTVPVWVLPHLPFGLRTHVCHARLPAVPVWLRYRLYHWFPRRALHGLRYVAVGYRYLPTTRLRLPHTVTHVCYPHGLRTPLLHVYPTYAWTFIHGYGSCCITVLRCCCTGWFTHTVPFAFVHTLLVYPRLVLHTFPRYYTVTTFPIRFCHTLPDIYL